MANNGVSWNFTHELLKATCPYIRTTWLDSCDCIPCSISCVFEYSQGWLCLRWQVRETTTYLTLFLNSKPFVYNLLKYIHTPFYSFSVIHEFPTIIIRQSIITFTWQPNISYIGCWTGSYQTNQHFLVLHNHYSIHLLCYIDRNISTLTQSMKRALHSLKPIQLNHHHFYSETPFSPPSPHTHTTQIYSHTHHSFSPLRSTIWHITLLESTLPSLSE